MKYLVSEKFNVLSHDLVPEHILLTEEEAVAVLEKLGVDRSKLPKIRKDDAAILALEQSYDKDGNKVGPIKEGSVIKVIRKSKTAEEFPAYRLVIGGGEYKDRFAEKMNKWKVEGFDEGSS